LIAFLMIGTLTHCAKALADDQPRRPNVLLILTDDQGYGDIASHGNEQIDTPVLDKLAADGARCDRFFVSPVCAPTRAALLTGRYHPRTGVHGVTRSAETMRAEEVTLAELLRQAGYATGCFGKWHNGAHWPQNPQGQGFDEFLGFSAGHWNNYHDPLLEQNGKLVRKEGFIIDVLTDEAIGFIERNKERPWLCYLPYNTPHTPWQVPDEYWQKYTEAKGIQNRETACAYAMVENIDTNVGRVLETLDRLKLADDTIVLFLTDNGANSDRYNAGMKGRKGSLDEGGTRVPLFIRYPGQIPAGTVVEPITAHIDVLPTLLDFAGLNDLETPPLDGKSLKPLLQGDTTDWPRRTLFTHWGGTLSAKNPSRLAVRTDRWRAVNMRDWKLYDMQADPGQTKDVAEDYPEVLADLKQQAARWAQDVTVSGFEVIPTEIGHPQAPVVTLPGHEAFLHPKQGEGISYHGPSGWANDFVDNWTKPTSYPAWEVLVVRPGRYRVTFQYSVPEESAGTELRVTCGSAELKATLETCEQAKQLTMRDRIGRKEVADYEWPTWTLGELELPEGRHSLQVRCDKKTGSEVIEVKSVRLERVD
jgi:arylsulfatase A